jgi:hypothetical protein
MTVLFQTNERDYPAGLDRSADMPLDVGVTRIQLTLTRVNWPDLGAESVVEAMLEISLDGGQTWPVLAGFTTLGGQSMMDGQPVNISACNCPVPQPQNPNRRVRARVTTAAQIRTALTVEVF